MKKAFILIAAVAFFSSNQSFCQTAATAPFTINDSNIINLKIPYTKTTHIVSPEPVLYVDISTPYVEGDLPEKNIVRLKPTVADAEDARGISRLDNFTVTVVTQSFIMSYKLSFNAESKLNNEGAYLISIDPTQALQLNTNNKVTAEDYHRLVLQAIGNKRSIYNVSARDKGMELWLANVYVIGDIILIDLAAKNHTNLQYDINSVDFKLMDKYTVSASVSQSTELKPLYQFQEDKDNIIEHKWHNYYIFKKFTFPDKRVLNIRLTEKPISGRSVELNIDYNQILQSNKLLN